MRRVRFPLWSAVAGLVALGLTGAASFTAAPPRGPTRLFGADRFGTAAAVSAATFPSGSALVYLATGLDFPDALSAAAAAGAQAPVLLTGNTFLPYETANELHRLQPSRVLVVGGTSAISDAVLQMAHAEAPSASVTRVTGTDRFDTAAALAALTFPSGARTAYVATGLDYPDALAAAGVAAGASPVLLVTNTLLPEETALELGQLHPSTVHIVGGVNAISDNVMSRVEALVPSARVDRIAGPDRFSTAVALSELAYPNGTPDAFVATGFDFPDALSAVVAAAGRGPVLLASDPPFSSTAQAELQRLKATSLVAVGGAEAISATLFNDLSAALSAAPPPVSGGAAVAVATAREQLGKPYLWAGAGPQAFDCSGLVMYAWAAAGVVLPHNTEAQADALPPVPIADLQPGDIVFYGTPGNVYHDGIYIGDGQMIEAAHSGVPVRIADIQRPDLLIGGRP